MATALDLITDALLEIGVASVGEPVSPEDANLGLSTLNSLLEDWYTQNLSVFTSTDYTYTFVPGQSTYTVGPSGNFNGPRPLSFISPYVRYNNTDFPIELINQDQYNSIATKSQPGILPAMLNYSAGFPLAVAQFWPVPTLALPFIFSTNSPISGALALVTTLALPPGYYRALRLNLAIELAQRYGRVVGPQTVKLAATSLGDLKRVNKRTPVATYDDALLQRGSSYIKTIAGY